MNQLQVVYLDVFSNEVKKMTIDDDLKTFYKMLNCNIVEMPERRIGENEKYFTIIVDEEGLLKTNPIPSAIDPFGKPCLAGNLIICDSDWETGELASLSDDEVEYIKNHIQPVSTVHKLTKEVKSFFMLTQCSY